MTATTITTILAAHREWLESGGARGARADLSDTDLRGTALHGADLRDADLSDTNLHGADLQGADLRGADLRDADLSDATLRAADLRGADLSDATLRGATLQSACWGGTRLHRSGVWSRCPPRCSAGDWHALVVAPGVVQIGCVALAVAEWLGAEGERLADREGVSPDDRETLRDWLTLLDARTEWPGWVSGEKSREKKGPVLETATTITDALRAHRALLQRVRTEAGECGDFAQCALCTLALDGDDAALAAVAESLEDAADERSISHSQLVSQLWYSAGL